MLSFIVLLAMCCTICYGDISFGESADYDMTLYPVSITMRDGENLQGYLDLYPYQEMHTYVTKPIPKGADILSLVRLNHEHYDSLTVYTEFVQRAGFWLTGGSSIKTLSFDQIERITLLTDFRDEDYFSPDNNPDLREMNCTSEVPEEDYRLIQKETVAILLVPQNMYDLILISTNPEVKQLDLYFYSRLMIRRDVYGGGNCHPYLNYDECYRYVDETQYKFWSYKEEDVSEVILHMTKCKNAWLEIAEKLKYDPYVLPEIRPVCIAQLLNLSAQCDSRLAELEEFYKNKTPLGYDAQDLYMRQLKECILPELFFPSHEGIEWEKVLRGLGIIEIYLQRD
jgi:hypothetical protein